MNVLADGRCGGHGLDDPGREVCGIGARESDALQAVDRSHRTQQVGKVVPAVVIAVDCLAEQGDLGCALLHQPYDFPDDIFLVAAPLWTARLWNDAERAAVIAAALYRDERGWSLFAHRRHILVVLP